MKSDCSQDLTSLSEEGGVVRALPSFYAGLGKAE